jgi:cell division septum initiation protein DivIVA
MSDTTYPNLGFNPVPGVPDQVEAMGSKISAAVDSLAQANGLLGRLRDSNDSVWQGEAGDAFRQHFNDTLATDLAHAHTSLDKAVGLVKGWHTDLVSFKDAASKLDQEAADAKRQLQQAQTELEQAQANPNLKLAGQHFDDQAALQRAQSLLDAAESAVRSAGSKAENAQGLLDSIMKRAKELEAEHDKVARRVADELEHATDRLAPHKPGFFSQLFSSFTQALGAVGNWIKDHLDVIHSVLSTISAIAGLVALLTPPPIDVIALGVSVAAGAGALAIDIANPEFRNGIGQLLQGHFDKQSLGAAMTGVTDMLSVVPGISVAADAVKAGRVTAESASALPKIIDIASAVAHKPGIPAQLISKIPGVGTALEATKLIDQGSSAYTMVTQNMVNILWKGKSVASDLYHDVKQAVG